jgi:hypothetical protein
MERLKYQRQRIEDLISKAIHDGYLIETAPYPQCLPSEYILSINWEGRHFLKPIPFFNAFLNEYGYVWTFVFGAGGTAALAFIQYFLHLL